MKKKLLKVMLLPSMFAVLSPTMAMTACGSVSQFDLPFVTTGSTIVQNQATSTVLDHDGKLIKDYAPSSFVYSSSQATNKLHVFCEPQDASVIDDATKKTTLLPEEYYVPGSNQMAITNVTDKEKPVKLFRNVNLSQLSNGVLSISNNLSHLFAYALTYQSRSEILDINKMAAMYGIDKTQSGLAKAYEKSSTENHDFFEFNFALNNLLSEGRSAIKFGVSGFDFQFKDFKYTNFGLDKQFGFGPIANAEIEERFVGKKDGHSPSEDKDTNYGFDDHVRLTTTKIGDVKDAMVVPSTIESIPIPISGNDLKLSFYDPLETKSFLPNDWLINDTTDINSKISETKSWNAFSKYSNADAKVNSLSWNVNCSVNNTAPTTDIVWPTNRDSIFKLYEKDLSYSDFIVLGNYGYTAEKAADTEKPGEVERALVFTGISGIYPAFFFTDEKSFHEVEVTVPKKDEKEKRYFTNKKYLDERLTKLNKSLTNHETNNEDLRTFLKYTFLKNTATDVWEFDVSNYLSRRY